MKTITCWTRQVTAMAEELKTDGTFRVKEEYIRMKNDNISYYYLDLYRWYTNKSREYIEIPEGAQFPIWFSLTEEYRLQPTPGTVVLKMEIPRDKLLIIDSEKWDYRGNNMYVPKDKADREAFEQKLSKYGIGDETALVEQLGNFYPMLKKELVASWERIFTMPPSDLEKGFATCWELKQDWVKEVTVSE